uniref:Integrase catalytic domain-containing protein n=1 Tax=Tanacetum cinerariifolium TaxID=118510 RepID=A0A6L2JG88_TANCI|nr:hypothetical protein [Tanacetum cinerariifolium]
MMVASKVHMLKPGEYELWMMRMEQYIQMVDYSLWDVIKNGNAPPITKVVEGVEITIAPARAEEKVQRRLELKARRTLLMEIPNEQQLKFNSIKDAKLQKLISLLEIYGESILQVDVNQKFLRSLSPEWNTHTIVWRNKPEIDTLSLDYIYNNLKIYESEDLQQTYPNDLEEMDLRWQMAMLTMRARRFLKNTGNKFSLNGNETIGFDKSKVECYNCHKRGHFAKEYIAPRSQDTKHKESSRRTVPVEIPASVALVSCDGLGEFVNEPIVSEPIVKKPEVETSEAKASAVKPKVVRKNFGPPLSEDWISDGEDEAELKPKIEKKTVKPSFAKIEFVKSTKQVKSPSKTIVKQDYEEINEGYIAFGGNPKGGKITGRDHKGKVIKYDNGAEFKNKEMNLFCEMKGIMREYSEAKTSQQNGVAKKRNRILIEAARTMLADSKLSTTFWAEVVNTTCYVQNRVLVVKPHNKTPYELFHGKFDGKADEGFFIGYSLNSKTFKVFNNRTRIVEENLHIKKKVDEDPRQESKCSDQEKEDNVNNTDSDNAAGINKVNVVGANTNNELPFDPEMHALEDVSTFNFSSDHEDDDEITDMNNLDITIQVSPTPTIRIHKDHPLDQVIGDLHSTTQTRHMSNHLEKHRTESRSDNMVGKPHGVIISWIIASKNIKKVIEGIDAENWQMTILGC